MLELYHGGPGANSLKALLPLKEKGIDFTSHPMNLLRFEQHEPWFVKISADGAGNAGALDAGRAIHAS
jgi:glutathione S-transferase